MILTKMDLLYGADNLALMALGFGLVILMAIVTYKIIITIIRVIAKYKIDNAEYKKAQFENRYLEEKQKQLELDKKSVFDNSRKIQRIYNLNKSINIRYIGKNGCISECYDAPTKASFDAITENGLYEELVLSFRDEIEYFLSARKENESVRKSYITCFRSFVSDVTEEECSRYNISYQDFKKIEENYANEMFLEIPIRFKMKFKVGYSTPKGKKAYTKTIVLSHIQLENEINAIHQREEFEETEKYKRKIERGRMTLSLRYDILKRDNFRCCICGSKASENVKLEVDHIIPISKGGTTVTSNLQTLCRDCNRGKQAK